MSPDTVIREWFRQVWEDGQEDAIDRLMAADAPVHGIAGPGAAQLRGPAEFKPYFHTMRAALSDIHVEVKRTVVQGDMCAAHCHVRARHTGDALGGPATGRPVDFWGMVMVRVRGTQIVEGWNCFDFLSMYQQVGWVSAPVASVAAGHAPVSRPGADARVTPSKAGE